MDVSAAKHEQGSLELTEDIVRARAYRFYEDRGCEDGYDLEDWLRAEAEVFGTKPAVAGAEDMEGGSMAAVALARRTRMMRSFAKADWCRKPRKSSKKSLTPEVFTL